MINKAVTLCIFLLFSFISLSFAQNNLDVVYLKNGGIRKGKVTKQTPKTVAIQTQGDNLFIFDRTEVSKIGIDQQNKKTSHKNKQDASEDDLFINITEVGILLGKSNNGEEAHLSFSSVFGFQANDYLSIGLGMGMDVLNDSKIFPIFLDTRAYLRGGQLISPYVYANLGYGFTSGDNIVEYVDMQKGGITYGGGLGLKINRVEKADLFLGLGYKSQGTYANYEDNNGGLHERSLNLQRITIKLGIGL